MLRLLIVCALSLYLLISKASAQPIIWKVQSNKLAGSLQLKLEQQLAQTIAMKSNQQLIIRIKPENGFVGLRQGFTAARLGEIDGLLMSPQYWGGADPVFAIMGDLVAAWKSPAQYRYWLEKQQGIRHLRASYLRQGLVLIGYMVSPTESLVSMQPIAKLADFKNRLMRTPPGMVTEFFKSLGAKPRQITIAQVAPGLTAGQIQTADYSNLVVNHYVGLYQQAKYTNYPGFHSMPLLDFVVNLKTWHALDPTLQEVVIQATQQWQTGLDNAYRAHIQEVLQSLDNEGVIVQSWTPRELILAREQAIKVWDNYANKSIRANVLIEELKAWLIKIGNISAID